MAARNQTAFHHRFTLALQASIVSDDALAEVLKLLTERFRCLAAALVYIDEGFPGATIEVGYGVLDAAVRRRYREIYSKVDPAPAAMARLKVGEVATTDRLFDIENESYARFRDEFYYPLGFRGTMGGPVAKARGRFGVLAVQRGADRPAFGTEETAEFAGLVPLVASALALRRKFFDLEASVETLQHALEDLSVAILLLNANGRLRHANRFARHFLERQDGLLLTRTGQLKLADSAADQRLQACFAQKPYADSLILRVPRKDAVAPYVLRALRSGGNITVKVCDPFGATAEADATLQLAFDMPLGSARLTAALLRGKTIADYAVEAGLSHNTMKFHLKNAFAATATKRQSDLVRVATAIVRELA